jgi:hypothetical protein
MGLNLLRCFQYCIEVGGDLLVDNLVILVTEDLVLPVLQIFFCNRHSFDGVGELCFIFQATCIDPKRRSNLFRKIVWKRLEFAPLDFLDGAIADPDFLRECFLFHIEQLSDMPHWTLEFRRFWHGTHVSNEMPSNQGKLPALRMNSSILGTL